MDIIGQNDNMTLSFMPKRTCPHNFWENLENNFFEYITDDCKAVEMYIASCHQCLKIHNVSIIRWTWALR